VAWIEAHFMTNHCRMSSGWNCSVIVFTVSQSDHHFLYYVVTVTKVNT